MPPKKAMVTGASGGIGREFAVQLDREGWQVTAVARDEARLKELLAGLKQKGQAHVADLSTPEGLATAMAELKSQRYELLVNNAGFGVRGKFLDAPLEKHLNMLDLNVKALVALAYAFLGQAKEGDALVNVSSGLAFLPMPALGLYSASKALVTSFSESLWHEQKARGVYVMDLCPGITETRFNQNSGGGELKVPRAMVQTAEQVVAKALRALKARKRPTVSSGALNAFFAFTARLRSRKSVVSQMGSMD
jgi:short-subunit dehydrogenase